MNVVVSSQARKTRKYETHEIKIRFRIFVFS